MWLAREGQRVDAQRQLKKDAIAPRPADPPQKNCPPAPYARKPTDQWNLRIKRYFVGVGEP
jgi:hypothetical protein